MDKKVVSVSHRMKSGMLDDDYTLYSDGTVLHEYDKHMYPGGQNYKDQLIATNLSNEVKQRLLEAASSKDKELVRRLLNLD